MGSYEDTISVLEAELAAVERVFAGLSGDQWRLPTKLVPVDPDLPHWTVFELTGHFDIAIGLTRMLIAGREASRPGTGPVSSSTRGRRPHRSSTAMPTRWCRARRPPTCRACCVDLTQALGREPIAAAQGIAAAAAILDDLLARRTVPGRPAELSDDLDWIVAASGRAASDDNRLPLIG
jgi:hypothetical protein